MSEYAIHTTGKLVDRTVDNVLGLVKKLIFYPHSWHILALDVEHEEVIEDVCGYIDRLYANNEVIETERTS